MNTLFNEFKLIIKEALEVHYIQLLRENFDLAFQYFNEVQSLINKAPSNRILGSVFINNYANYKSTFQEFAYLPSSNEFLKFIEDNFYNVSNYVLDYINKKIQSVNKYYFNESQRDEFYRLELIEQEIERVSSNIKNFFNELNLETEINTMILNITFDQISTLNSENIKTLDNLYKNIYRETQETRIYGSGCDVVRLIIRKKRTKVIKHKLVYDYYCRATAKSQKNINKIIRNLTVTKQYLSQNFSNHIENFINKFDCYLNNYINCSQTLYNNLYNYTDEKSNNNTNMEIILNDYKNIFNTIKSKYSFILFFIYLNKLL